MELTIKQYADSKNIGKGYIHRIVRNFKTKGYLLADVASVKQKTDAFGTKYYVLKMKSKRSGV